jgi:hypothetical protein
MFNNDPDVVRAEARQKARGYLREIYTLDEVEIAFNGILHESTRTAFGADPSVVINPGMVAALVDEVRLAAAKFDDPEMSAAVVAAADRAVESHYWFADVWFSVYLTVRGTFELVWQDGGMTEEQRVGQIALYNGLIKDGVDGYFDWHALRYLLGGAEFGYFVDDLTITDEMLANWHMTREALEGWLSSDRPMNQAITLVKLTNSAHRDAAAEAAGGVEVDKDLSR